MGIIKDMHVEYNVYNADRNVIIIRNLILLLNNQEINKYNSVGVANISSCSLYT